MRQAKIFLFLLLAGCAGTVNRKPNSEPPIDAEKVNACLDQIRLQTWNGRRHAGKVVDTQQASEWHRPVKEEALPSGCEAGTLENFRQALKIQIASCKASVARGEGAPVQLGCRAYTRREWCLSVNSRMLELATAAPDMAALLLAAKKEFDWLQNTGAHATSNDGRIQKGEVKFTGYYSPTALEASSVRTEKFAYPFYRAPPDLLRLRNDEPESCGTDKINGRPNKICRREADGTLVQYHDRRAIVEERVLEGRGLEIGFVEDPLSVINVHLQGSGSLKISSPDGTSKLVHLVYEGSNGRNNNFLSRIFKCLGAAPKEYANISEMRKYLNARPSQINTILSFDPYYAFFKPEKNGPFGTDNLSLTAGHSLAADRAVVPTGAVMLFQTRNPEAGARAQCPQVASLGISQDTGGAVVGAHFDWYMGEGPQAQERAENIHAPGSVFVALPKGAGRPVARCKDSAP